MIALDGTFIQPGKVGGAEHMFRNLVSGLVEQQGPEALTVFVNEGMAPHWQGKAVNLIEVAGANRFLRSTRVLYKFGGSMRAIIFPNYYTPPRQHNRKPIVLTVIHDLLYWHHPRTIPHEKRVWLRLAHELTLRAADKVIAISDFTRADILRHFGDRWADVVSVIPNPISWDRFRESEEADRAIELVLENCEGPVILAVAAHYEHKNLSTLVRSIALLRKSRGFEGATLILIGQLRRDLLGIRRTPDLAIRSDDASIRVLGYVDDATIGAAFRRADVFAFPSLFEGFGMPAVEALGMGLPVVTSNLAALPETTLGLGYYVDEPLRPEAWAAALSAVLSNPTRWRPSSSSILAVRQAYDPTRIAGLYMKLAGGSREDQLQRR